jgi:predicted enzyme related to lactoylglutathione lyase
LAKAIGVGGVFFKSANPKRLAKWYSRHLGIGLLSPTAASFKPADMPRDGLTVWSPFPADTRYFAPSRRPYMVNLVVDDLEGALRQVARGGAKLAGEIQEYPYGRFGWFMDPDGNKVELWEVPRAKPRARKRPKAARRGARS